MAAAISKIDADAKRLVLARLDALPSNIGVAVGSEGNYSKEQLLEHIESEDQVGREFVEIELEFLRMLKEGALFEE